MGVLSLTHRTGLGLDRTAAARVAAAPGRPARHSAGAGRRPAALRRGTCARVRRCWMRCSASRATALARVSRGRSARPRSKSRGRGRPRWCAGIGRRARGELAFRHRGHRAPRALAARGASVVAEACRTGKLQVLEDARAAALGPGSLRGAARVIQEPGSVAIDPARAGWPHARRAGARGGRGEGAHAQEEARPLTVLGGVVAGSLELVWQFAEVDKRARTDPLTGLWNRHALRRAAAAHAERRQTGTATRCRSCSWTSTTSSGSTTPGDIEAGDAVLQAGRADPSGRGARGGHLRPLRRRGDRDAALADGQRSARWRLPSG